MIKILQGDVRERLVDLADDSFDCIVTSPPYWGLRDYGVAGQIGLESNLVEYLNTMVHVCRHLRRVLKPSGVFFLNIGDSYAGGGRGGNPPESVFTKQATNAGSLVAPIPLRATGLKPKDLCMVPNRLAIRLQEDGWYVRSEIIWHKPNPMPESVTDRPTSSHEKIWLLTKSEQYWYDADAIREENAINPNWNYGSENYRQVVESGGGGRLLKYRKGGKGWHGCAPSGPNGNGRNARNVWSIASQPYAEAHFATFPPELAERCIKAGCPPRGSVLDPFGGAGTTAMVADRLGRDCTLIELNADYVELIQNRIQKDAGMFAQLEAVT